ncbi:MAG: hypothetical protein MJK04_12255 [Psychrosphaera sp.]|nr:hypothetical protein [Psychrosphaera sp.]
MRRIVLLPLLFILMPLLIVGSSFSTMAGQCATLIDQMENMGQLKKILRCLDNKVANTTSAEPKPFQRSKIKTKITTQRYLFEVEHCLRKASNVTCTLILTNKNKTIYSPDYREFGIYTADSNFFDEYGNEYNASQARMGKVVVEAQGPSNRKSFKDGYLEKYMSLGIPMKLTMTFADVGNLATTVMALNIKFSYRDGKTLSSSFVTLEGNVIELY